MPRAKQTAAAKTAGIGTGGKRKRQPSGSQAADKAAPLPDVFVVRWSVSASIKEFVSATSEDCYVGIGAHHCEYEYS
jgi:hypothetical protein